jgi:hypothetical protein
MQHLPEIRGSYINSQYFNLKRKYEKKLPVISGPVNVQLPTVEGRLLAHCIRVVSIAEQSVICLVK